MSDFTFGAVRSARRSWLRGAIADAALLLHEMMRARSTRRMLVDMDDRQLADIGVGRSDAFEESRRPMWDLGHHRR